MIHLHVHSQYSLLCGACSPAELIARAVDIGFSALALTDLNAMYGTVEFQKECEQAGLRAIHGVEITDDRPVDTDPVRLIAGSLQPGRPRAVLLARDESGYAAICRLTTLRQVRPDFRLTSMEKRRKLLYQKSEILGQDQLPHLNFLINVYRQGNEPCLTPFEAPPTSCHPTACTGHAAR